MAETLQKEVTNLQSLAQRSVKMDEVGGGAVKPPEVHIDPETLEEVTPEGAPENNEQHEQPTQEQQQEAPQPTTSSDDTSSTDDSSVSGTEEPPQGETGETAPQRS